MQIFVIMWNLGIKLNVSIVMSVGIAILFYYAGVLIEKSKRNYFIGIRTPWTLASDKVWDKTHRLGGKLFKVDTLLALVGILFPPYTFYFVLVPVLTSAIWTIIYSYLEFKKTL